ncbi:MAG: endonuclease Q family protein [Treponema sp.]|jgi:PHP family Zn ribbon phosphoesterase|nr:endonuclease Q family protein [Treponema sp.]
MKVTADLHVHSRFSLATSRSISPASLDYWARVKGIGLAGTGDCTHPAWLDELRGQLDEAEEGLFTLKRGIRAAFDASPAAAGIPVSGSNAVPRFVLTGEISTVYRKDGRTRKVHHLVILPGFAAAAAFQAKLERAGNIRSDGRPTLGIDSRELLSLLLEADERGILVPAHIWTPWFSVLGAKSGFDSIGECYGDLAPFIPAVETGLSSNPPMNWAVPSLDRFSIISNSDAHSPEKLGREATVFDMELSFASLAGALRFPDGTPADVSVPGVSAPDVSVRSILYTLEFFPQEGKYHYDGHRKCGAGLSPEEAGDGLCPVCGRPLTMGVLRRVTELAGRPVDERAACPPNSEGTNRRPYVSLVPLRELAAELLGTGAASKKAGAAYASLVGQAGSELGLLVDAPLSAVEKMDAPGIPGEKLAEAVSRMRAGRVAIRPGYDGVYGVVRVFPEGEGL